MRIQDSICGTGGCKHFEHQCEEDTVCQENCFHPDKGIRERFYDMEDGIKECEGYEV